MPLSLHAGWSVASALHVAVVFHSCMGWLAALTLIGAFIFHSPFPTFHVSTRIQLNIGGFVCWFDHNESRPIPDSRTLASSERLLDIKGRGWICFPQHQWKIGAHLILHQTALSSCQSSTGIWSYFYSLMFSATTQKGKVIVNAASSLAPTYSIPLSFLHPACTWIQRHWIWRQQYQTANGNTTEQTFNGLVGRK